MGKHQEQFGLRYSTLHTEAWTIAPSAIHWQLDFKPLYRCQFSFIYYQRYYTVSATNLKSRPCVPPSWTLEITVHLHRPKRKPGYLPKQPARAEQFAAMGGHQPEQCLSRSTIAYSASSTWGDGSVWMLTSHMGLFVLLSRQHQRFCSLREHHCQRSNLEYLLQDKTGPYHRI